MCQSQLFLRGCLHGITSGADSYTCGSKGSLSPLPPRTVHSISGLGHVTCFGQRVIIERYESRGLQSGADLLGSLALGASCYAVRILKQLHAKTT